MTERELKADLRALIGRWEREVETHREIAERDHADRLEDCIADVKELLP